MDHIFNGTFGATRRSLSWVPEGAYRLQFEDMLQADELSTAGDGVFSTSEGGIIKLVDLKTNTTTDLLDTKDVRDVRRGGIALRTYLAHRPRRNTVIASSQIVGNSPPT